MRFQVLYSSCIYSGGSGGPQACYVRGVECMQAVNVSLRCSRFDISVSFFFSPSGHTRQSPPYSPVPPWAHAPSHPEGTSVIPEGNPFQLRGHCERHHPGGLDGDCAGRKRSFNGCGQVCFVAEEKTIVLKNCILPRYLANYLG